MANLRWIKQKAVIFEKAPVRAGSEVLVEGRHYESSALPQQFTIYRTYSWLVTNYLRKRHKPIAKALGQLDAMATSPTSARSDLFRTPTRGRLKIPLHSVDDLGNVSPTIFSAHLAGLSLAPNITVLGTGGGIGSVELVTTVDPEIELVTLLPWPSTTGETIHSVVAELAEDAYEASEDESLASINEALLREASWALPAEPPAGWEIWFSQQSFALEEGEVAVTTLNASVPTVGAAAFALQATAQDLPVDVGRAVSDIMVIEREDSGALSLTFL